ncbi:MAG: twin-arginine translocation signal domain-containing protein [Kiritimatiellae bacterium]|nr:twin-arginine translocation signal domain-containing protein [Kiritimatiellia bacterium]
MQASRRDFLKSAAAGAAARAALYIILHNMV